MPLNAAGTWLEWPGPARPTAKKPAGKRVAAPTVARAIAGLISAVRWALSSASRSSMPARRRDFLFAKGLLIPGGAQGQPPDCEAGSPPASTAWIPARNGSSSGRSGGGAGKSRGAGSEEGHDDRCRVGRSDRSDPRGGPKPIGPQLHWAKAADELDCVGLATFFNFGGRKQRVDDQTNGVVFSETNQEDA